MKYQIGDTIIVLQTDEEGKVVEFINDKMVLVEIRGVRFPVYLDQIDFPYFKRFTQKKIQNIPVKKQLEDLPKEKRVSLADRKEDGVWLSFIPIMTTDEFGDDIVESLKIHVINRTKTAFNFYYQLFFLGEKDFELKNNIQPFQDFYLHDIPFSDLNDSPVFNFQFSLAVEQKNKAPYHETQVKLKPKQLFNAIEKIRQNNEAMFSHILFETYPDKTEDLADSLGLEKLTAKGYKVYKASEAREYLEPARSLVDLHIEKLTDNWKKMSNFEILTLQLQTFEKYYDLAVAHRQPSLIIIHGVGEGRLRNDIHESLRLKKEVKSFVNQYHPNYGYGATEIWFQY